MLELQGWIVTRLAPDQSGGFSAELDTSHSKSSELSHEENKNSTLQKSRKLKRILSTRSWGHVRVSEGTLKNSKVQATPKTITSESVEAGSRPTCFLQLSRWFQIAGKPKNRLQKASSTESRETYGQRPVAHTGQRLPVCSTNGQEPQGWVDGGQDDTPLGHSENPRKLLGALRCHPDGPESNHEESLSTGKQELKLKDWMKTLFIALKRNIICLADDFKK